MNNLKFLQDKEMRLKTAVTNDGTQLTHVLYNIKRLSEEKIIEDEVLKNITLAVDIMKAESEQLKNELLTARYEINDLAGFG